MLVSPRVDVIALLFGSEVHFEPVLFQIVVVVGPTGLEVLVPLMVDVDLFGGVQPVKCDHIFCTNSRSQNVFLQILLDLLAAQNVFYLATSSTKNFLVLRVVL